MLNLNNINLKFQNTYILKDINLELSRGEITCLIGPNGCGKTSIIKTICGIHKFSSGEITLNGHDLKKTASSKISPVFQGLYLWPNLTALENIKLVLESQSFSEKENKKILDYVINELKLSNFLDKYPEQISGGQQQKVAIARAIILKPDFLLLDEITSALDVEQIKFVADILLDFKKSGVGILFITHHIGLAEKISDKFIFMDKGTIKESGDINKLRSGNNQRLKSFLEYV